MNISSQRYGQRPGEIVKNFSFERILLAVSSPARTPLYDRHVNLGGRMVEFAGYELPVQYQSIIAEATAVRQGTGIFDVSHMARLTISGTDALAFLEHVTTNDVASLEIGKGQYSMLTNENGGVIDDIILYRVDELVYKMVVNAANHAKDTEHLSQHVPQSVSIEDTTTDTAMIAVQGPEAVELVAKLSPDAGRLRSLEFFAAGDVKVAGCDCFAARSGYTGEDGFELVCSADQAAQLWDALVDAGATPCGLGSRDTLRVEAGLPLYGHELSDDLSPIAAGLGWVISKTKPFLGSDAIAAVRETGPARKIQGIRLESKRIPAPSAKVFVEGQEVGEVTSAVYSPLLGCGIGFALVDAAIPLKTPAEVEVRTSREQAQIVGKRFFKRG